MTLFDQDGLVRPAFCDPVSKVVKHVKFLLTLSLFGSLLLQVPAAASEAPSLFQVDLFRGGGAGVNTYRIPALVQSGKGTLIAVADARFDSAQDLPGHIALAMRRSFDNGNHWTPTRIILQPAQGGVGDASLLLDRSNGRVWCFHAYGPPGIGFNNSKPGELTGLTTLQLHAIYSDDDGETWSAPVDITPQVKDRSWQAFFATSGTSIQTSRGRFLVPIVVRDSKGGIHSANISSDDHGKTWKHGDLIGDGTDESHNVELKDGTILQNMRNGPTRALATSTDAGVSFGPVTHDPALIDARCNAGFARYQHGNIDALIFTNAASRIRENLTVKVSYDDGVSWPVSRLLNAGPSAYSTVIFLANGEVGVLYERGKRSQEEEITFARFAFPWITQGSTRPAAH